jgi:hypothetical protein
MRQISSEAEPLTIRVIRLCLFAANVHFASLAMHPHHRHNGLPLIRLPVLCISGFYVRCFRRSGGNSARRLCLTCSLKAFTHYVH